MRKIDPLLAVLAFLAFLAALSVTGCSCCLYFNHWYNAKEAFDEAERLRLARLDSLPGDTVWVADSERVQYQRVIEKCSRILERWPEEEDYKPRVLFTMGEAYRRMGEWNRAVRKYDEYLRYFPDGNFAPDAEYERAFCLHKANQPQQARFALEPLVADTAHPRFAEALSLLATIAEGSQQGLFAIENLEKMLASGGGSSLLRAQVRLRLARLYTAEKMHEKAVPTYLAPDIATLRRPAPWEARFEAAHSLSALGKHQEAADLLLGLAADTAYADFRPKAEMARAAELLFLDPPDSGVVLFLKLIDGNPKTEIASEAWYRLGYHDEGRGDYDRAISDYDSSVAQKICDWERMARERRNTLQRIERQREIALDTAKPRNWAEEFQIAELFLFRLDRADSALARLDSLAADTAPDPAIRQRALYAKGFILANVMEDTAAANGIWRQVIEQWPNTDYAKQAQRILGLPVTAVTADDSAHAAFLAAESLLTAAQEREAAAPAPGSAPEPEAGDSARAEVPEGAAPAGNPSEAELRDVVAKMVEIDSLWHLSPDAPRALYVAARVSVDLGDTAQARALFLRVRNEFGGTPWSEDAARRLTGRLMVSEEYVNAEKRALEEQKKAMEKTPDYNRRFEEYKQEKAKQQKEEEELLWDYEEMYNVE